MKIICKTTLLAATAKRETRITINLDDAESLEWGISTLTFADGESGVTIDWGDGTVELISDTKEISHAYPAVGVYTVRISDQISSLGCSASTGPIEFRKIYPPFILAFESTAEKLTAISGYCFSYADHMESFNCEGSGIKELKSMAFRLCDALSGTLRLKSVDTLAPKTFYSCGSVTELVFDNANYEAISALDGFATKFGAENALIRFES